MTARAEVQILGRSVSVYELTVSDVRDWVAEHEAGKVVDPLHCLVFDDCSLPDLARMSDMTVEEMEVLGPSELEPLRAKARALNPHFFRVREALAGVSRAIQAGLESVISTAASPH